MPNPIKNRIRHKKVFVLNPCTCMVKIHSLVQFSFKAIVQEQL